MAILKCAALLCALCSTMMCASSTVAQRSRNEASDAGRQTLPCGTPLDDLAHLLPDLEYVDAHEPENSQVVCEARYRVSGKQAASVEGVLSTEFGVPRLRFACCGWESGGSEFRPGRDTISYTIEMYSEETRIRDRGRWKDISNFYVVARTVQI